MLELGYAVHNVGCFGYPQSIFHCHLIPRPYLKIISSHGRRIYNSTFKDTVTTCQIFTYLLAKQNLVPYSIPYKFYSRKIIFNETKSQNFQFTVDIPLIWMRNILLYMCDTGLERMKIVASSNHNHQNNKIPSLKDNIW
jgi:hypothetical protein